MNFIRNHEVFGHFFLIYLGKSVALTSKSRVYAKRVCGAGICMMAERRYLPTTTSYYIRYLRATYSAARSIFRVVTSLRIASDRGVEPSVSATISQKPAR